MPAHPLEPPGCAGLLLLSSSASYVLLLCGGLYGDLYERPYNKALSPGLAGPLLRRCGFARDEVVGRTMSIIQGPGTERDLMDGLMAHARRGEKGTGGLGGSLEPPGPLLTHLHTVCMNYSECCLSVIRFKVCPVGHTT